MLHQPLRLLGPDKGRSSRLADSVRFNQEQLSFTQLEKRFAATCIGALTEHSSPEHELCPIRLHFRCQTAALEGANHPSRDVR